ncbi:MAG: hypothetical protein ABH849_03330 [Nanoarchaeota archaeon]
MTNVFNVYVGETRGEEPPRVIYLVRGLASPIDNWYNVGNITEELGERLDDERLYDVAEMIANKIADDNSENVIVESFLLRMNDSPDYIQRGEIALEFIVEDGISLVGRVLNEEEKLKLGEHLAKFLKTD